MRTEIKNIWQYILLLILLCIFIGPFLWLLSTALKSGGENIFAFPPQLMPHEPTLQNFIKVFTTIPFTNYFINSIVVSLATVLLNVVFSAMAAYPLARTVFIGRKVCFLLVLASMLIPFQVTMIPMFVLTGSLGLKNSYLGLILPFAVSAFGIFLLRQAFLTVPRALCEAAVIDGCSYWQIWYKIMLPLIKPAVATLAIFTFVSSWGSFLWPLLILDEKAMYTLPLGVQDLQGMFGTDWRLVAAGAVASIVPIVIFFLFTQKYFIEGALSGGVKE